MPTTYHDLVTRFRADTTGIERGAAVASKSIGNFSSNARDATLLVQNFGEGIVDAQYGLRNITNNLDVVGARFQNLIGRTGSLKGAFSAIASGLLSPVGLITGLTLLINFGPQIYKWFKTWISGAEQASDALEKFNKQVADAQFTDDQRLLLDLQKDEQILLDEKLKLIEEYNLKLSQGFRNLGGLLDQIAAKDAEILENQEAQVVVNGRLLDIQKDRTNNIINEQLRKDLELMKAQGATQKELLTYELEQLENLKETTVGAKNYEDILHRIAVLKAKIAKIDLDVGASLLAHIRAEIEKHLKQFNEVGNELGQAVKSGLINALTGLGQAIGQVLAGEGSFGDKFLALLGNFMQAFGSALIAGGVALVAAGAALSSARQKNPAGGNSGTQYNPAAVSAVAPTRIQGSEQDFRVVGKIDGQDLRLVMQRAGDSYQGLS